MPLIQSPSASIPLGAVVLALIGALALAMILGGWWAWRLSARAPNKPAVSPAPAPAPAPPAAPPAAEPRPAAPAPAPGMSNEARVLPPPPKVPRCANCGEELDPNWILCPFCDTPVAK